MTTFTAGLTNITVLLSQ